MDEGAQARRGRARALRTSSRHGHAAFVLVALVIQAACSPPRAEAPLVVRELGSPAGPGSGEPNLAIAPDGRILLSWIEPGGEGRHTLRYAHLDGSGKWSPQQMIAEGAGWFVNWADFPALAVLPDGTLFAHWLAKSGPSTYAYDVQVASSRDGGATWNGPVVPHRDGTQTEHGFVSMTPWGPAAMGVIWLDGRKTAGAGHAHGAAGAEMSLMHTTMAADGTLGAETVLDGRVCDCCQTDAVRAGNAVVVVYRDRSEKEVRDISVVRFVDGRWSAPRTLAADGWEINGCPVNGPAIAASGAKVAVAWFTAPNDKAAVKIAFSNDAGATFSAPIAVDDGRPLGRVDVVLLEGDTALVSWLEQGEKGAANLRVRRITKDGSRKDAATVAVSSGARSSGFPRMVRSSGQVILAWRDAAEPPRVQTAMLEIGSRGRQ